MDTTRSTSRPMARTVRGLNRRVLQDENRRFRGTGGVSAESRPLGFRPAFRDVETGTVYPARFADGTPAPCHVLDGLPPQLVRCRDAMGRVTQVVANVVAGFVLADRFYTREQAAKHVSNC
jgi:hypothetical protein